MLNMHDEPSLQKESTLLSPNTTLDGDEASIQKKAPLVKLNGTPERNESSYLKKAPPTKLHEKHAKEKPGRTTAYRATLKDDKRSHQKAALPKTKGTLTKGIFLFKCLAAFCVPDSVGAIVVAASAPSSPPPPMLCDNFSRVKKVGIIGAGVAGLQAGMITNPNPIPDPDPNPDPDPEGGQRAAQGRSRGQGLRKERRSGRRLAG